MVIQAHTVIFITATGEDRREIKINILLENIKIIPTQK